MIETIVTLILMVMLVTTALAITAMRTMFTVVMLSGVFSLLTALLFMIMDAVDVAFTEAAVGAGITTFLLLGTLALKRKEQKPSSHSNTLPFFVVAATGAVLIYGTLDMPSFGAADAPANSHLRDAYIERSVLEIDIPNVVTAILASYRGFDTLGETAVVLTAGIGVLLLLGGRSTRRPSPRPPSPRQKTRDEDGAA